MLSAFLSTVLFSAVLSQVVDKSLQTCQQCQLKQSKTEFHTCSMCDGIPAKVTGDGVSEMVYDCINKTTGGQKVITGSGDDTCDRMYCLKNSSKADSGECSCKPCEFKRAVKSAMHFNVSSRYAEGIRNNKTARAEFLRIFRQRIAAELGVDVSAVVVNDLVISGHSASISADNNTDGYVTVSEYTTWREAQTGKILSVVSVDYKKFLKASGSKGRISAADFDRFVATQFAKVAKNVKFTATSTDPKTSVLNVTTDKGIKVVAGNDIVIQITAKDSNGLVNPSGDDSFFLVAYGNGDNVFLTPKYAGDGKYIASFQPTIAGKYSLRVNLRTSQTGFSAVGGSVALKVMPGKFNSELTTLERGVFKEGTVSVPEHNSYFDIVPRDSFSNAILAGDGYEMGVKFSGPAGEDGKFITTGNNNQLRNIERRQDGSYRVKFLESMNQPYRVEVSVDGTKLSGPFVITARSKGDDTTRHYSASTPAPQIETSGVATSGPCTLFVVCLLSFVLRLH